MDYIRLMRVILLAIFLLPALFFDGVSCRGSSDGTEYQWKELEVTVSAYNSLPGQTAGNPALTAWGDTLRPGMKSVAVSRDLIGLGLDYDTEVQIEGLDGSYRVNDKMNRRFSRHIDLYMGEDVSRAKKWGRKRLKIRFRVPVEADSLPAAPRR